MIVGTVAYMSPEQAEGKATDARSDIFSFGSVVYEMLSGVRPFAGESHISTLASILHKEPVPLRQLAPAVPTALEHLVSKCLRKDAEQRVQTARELSTALRRMSDELSGRYTSNAEAPASRSARTLVIAASIVLCVVAAVVTWRVTKPAPEPYSSMRMTRLTTTGNVTRAAISSDGKYVAYAARDGGEYAIWVRQVGTAASMRIATLPQQQWVQRIALSPDAQYVYYIAVDSGNGILTRVPVFGGRPEQVIHDMDTGPAFSPDGSQFAFVRFTLPNTATLRVAQSDGSGERVLSSKTSVGPVGQPAWSPDGEKIAWVNRTVESNSAYDAVILSSPAGRAEQVLASRKWWGTWAVQWLSRGEGLLISARESPGAVLSIWHIPLRGGEPRRITNDLSDYRGISITSDGRSSVTVQNFSSSTLWTADIRNTAAPVQITRGANSDDGVYGVCWVQNDRICYSSNAGTGHEIWTIAADGSDPRQVTNKGGRHAWPAAAPDGSWLVFAGLDENRGIHIWRAKFGWERFEATDIPGRSESRSAGLRRRAMDLLCGWG